MTAENFDSLIAELCSAQPFRLFTIELVGGRRVEVDYPYAISNRDGVAALIAPGGIPIWFDHESVLRVISARSTVEA